MSGNVPPLSKGVGQFRRIFDKEEGIAQQPLLVSEKVIAVSYGIKISEVHYLVLSQYTRLADRQAHRRTELR